MNPPQLTNISNCQPSELQTIQFAPKTWHMTIASSLGPSKNCSACTFPTLFRAEGQVTRKSSRMYGSLNWASHWKHLHFWHLSLQASLRTASQLIDRTYSCARGGRLTIHYDSVLFPQSSLFYMRTPPGCGFTKSCPAWRY